MLKTRQTQHIMIKGEGIAPGQIATGFTFQIRWHFLYFSLSK